MCPRKGKGLHKLSTVTAASSAMRMRIMRMTMTTTLLIIELPTNYLEALPALCLHSCLPSTYALYAAWRSVYPSRRARSCAHTCTHARTTRTHATRVH